MFPIQMKFRCFSLLFTTSSLNISIPKTHHSLLYGLCWREQESRSKRGRKKLSNLLARGQRAAPSDAPSLPFVLKLLWFRNDGNHFLSYFFNYSLHKQLSQKRKHQFRRKKCQYSMQIIIHVFRINPNLKHRFEFLTGTTTLTCVEEVYIDQPVLYKLSHILLGASGRTVQ